MTCLPGFLATVSKKAEFGLELAESKKKVLEEYTKEKTLGELNSADPEDNMRGIGHASDLGAGKKQALCGQEQDQAA